ncbi:uncharacterized protein [Periplaneta americana]|uniref:uncharacterized protein isoform X4 n=1 Tax=Periplaneta americana TaxID=6978 RepID=UPI0037E73BEB
MDVIKMEPDADPLGLEPQDDTYEIGDNNSLSEEGNLSHLEVTGMKTECVDHSWDLKSEIKVEDSPVGLTTVKPEVDDDLFDVDRVQQEQKVEVSSEEDEVLTERCKIQLEARKHNSY